MDASHYSRPTPSTRYRGPVFWLSFTVSTRDEAKASQNFGFILIVRKAHLAHRLVDEIPVTGFLPCKSRVDFTILTWDIFRSTDPRQSPLSPVFTFCVTDSSRSQNRLNFVHNHIEPPVKAFTSQILFCFLIQFSLISLSLSLSLFFLFNTTDDFSTILPPQIKTGRAPLSAFFFFFFF